MLVVMQRSRYKQARVSDAAAHVAAKSGMELDPQVDPAEQDSASPERKTASVHHAVEQVRKQF
jgi:hypothetical protein